MDKSSTAVEQPVAVFDELLFEQVFKEYYKALHAYAAVLLKDEETAEEIVQGMFLKLWEKRESFAIHASVKAFLYRCVHNDSLNHLKHLKVQQKYSEHASYEMEFQSNQPVRTVEMKELEERLREALAELPEQCLTIFQLSRYQEMKYREIADQLGISVKAVEKQMSKALKLLRIRLADFLPLVLLFMDKLFYR